CWPARDRSLLLGRHPAVEPEAIASELLAARGKGVPWASMAVLVRRPRHRGRAITRALARHGIPVTTPMTPTADEPVVRGVVDLLRWSAGDDTALERLLTTPLSGLDPADVRVVRREARDDGIAVPDH